MRRTAAPPTRTRRTVAPTAVGLLVVTAAIVGALLYRSGSSSATSLGDPASPDVHRAAPQSTWSSPPSFGEVLPRDRTSATRQDDRAVTEADGALPDRVTVFDDEYPGVANLDRDLLQALREATADAADDRVEIDITSGWRSRKYQNELLREAVSEYGSQKEAARWVATADTSPHVSGDAVDIGPSSADAWLSEHGAEYGLCQIYRNEPWHYELRPGAIDRGCPSMYADPTHDPRMRH